jgi:hypothetical protein
VPAATWLDHVAQLAQPVGELGLIDRGRELLSGEESTFLEGARCAVSALSEIEHDGMGVDLGCSVAINRAGGVVFELGRDKAPGCLRGVIAADSRLRVALQFGERRVDRVAMRFAYTKITTDQRGQRNRLWGGECCVPAGPMLYRLDSLSVLIRVLLTGAMAYQLIAGVGWWPVHVLRLRRRNGEPLGEASKEARKESVAGQAQLLPQGGPATCG